MENTLPEKLGISSSRANELYKMLHKIFNSAKGEESDIVMNILRSINDPLECSLMLFESGRIITEIACPIHKAANVIESLLEHGTSFDEVLVSRRNFKTMGDA